MIEAYYRQNYTRLVKTVAPRLDSNYAIAEEAVQEAFTKALTFIDAFKPNEHEIGAWFNTILNNCVKDAASKERNRGMSLDVLENSIPNKVNNNIFSITKKEILSSIDGMNDGIAKRVIGLYFKEGMAPRHICQALKLESNGYVRFIISTWRSGILKRYR